MFFEHKKKLILSAVLLILIFKLDIVKGCSNSNSDEASTKAPYSTAMTDRDATKETATTGMYIYRKSSTFNKAY